MTRDGRGAVLFDLDGTLVDSNYQHALAWYLAFRESGVVLPVWRIHRHIGMGGDQIVPALIGDQRDAQIGDVVRDAEKRQFARAIGEISPLSGAHELLASLHVDGFELVLASSSPQEHVDHYLDLLDAHELVAAVTSSADVESTKPAPDLIEVAKARARSRALVMVGDSPWDIDAAARGGLPCATLLTGGYSERELADAGASSVFSSLVDMRAAALDGWLGQRA